jgi:nucleotide-binding universal stress UspA family protein
MLLLQNARPRSRTLIALQRRRFVLRHEQGMQQPSAPQPAKGMYMYRSLLVPLDGSPFGEQALPLARAIAGQAGAVLHLAHVHVVAATLSFDAIPFFDEALDAQDRAREQAYLDTMARRLRAGGDLCVRTTVLDESIADALQIYAQTHHIDLVVMTTHGRGAFSRFWLGSVANTLVSHAPMPVLLIRPQEMLPNLNQAPTIRRILIPLDGSACAEQILPPATALGALMDAEFTLLHVIAPNFAGYGRQWPTSRPGTLLPTQLRARAQAYLDRVAERLGAQSLVVHTAVVDGQPTPAILEYACDHGIDLLAIATHGDGGSARLLLGSVADKVVRSASMPVLLYRPPAVADR